MHLLICVQIQPVKTENIKGERAFKDCIYIPQKLQGAVIVHLYHISIGCDPNATCVKMQKDLATVVARIIY